MRQTNTKQPKTCLGLVAAAGALLLLPSCNTGGYEMADANNDGGVTPAEFNRYMLEAIFAAADANAVVEAQILSRFQLLLIRGRGQRHGQRWQLP